jgi:cytochrome c biogenesis protein CcmG, thiol:disulfide interchange protein DsbE
LRCAGDIRRGLSDLYSAIINLLPDVKNETMMIFILILFITIVINSQDSSESNTGRTAPNFKLENIESEVIELNDYVGKGPVLLCFWSSCCKSAVAQIEEFSFLYDKYKYDGFVMLAIATDDEKTVAKVKPFVKIKKYGFPVLYDTDGAVSRSYYAVDNPFSVLINKSGKIIYSRTGFMKGDEIELQKIIQNLLNQ